MIAEKIALSFPNSKGSSIYYQRSLGRGVESGVRSWLKLVSLECMGVGLLGEGFLSGSYRVPFDISLMELGLRYGGLEGLLLGDLSLALAKGISGSYSLVGKSAHICQGSFSSIGFGDGARESLLLNIRGGLEREGFMGSVDISLGISEGVFKLMSSGIVHGGFISGVGISSPSSGLLTAQFLGV